MVQKKFCHCRRRGVLSKLVAVSAQALVVVVVWYTVSVRNQYSRRTEVPIPMSGDNGEAKNTPCSPGDFSKGDTLHLDMIISRGKGLDALSGRQTGFLNVEVLIRDLEQGSLTVYPIGSPVVLVGDAASDVIDDEDGETRVERDHEIRTTLERAGGEDVIDKDEDLTDERYDDSPFTGGQQIRSKDSPGTFAALRDKNTVEFQNPNEVHAQNQIVPFPGGSHNINRYISRNYALTVRDSEHKQNVRGAGKILAKSNEHSETLQGKMLNRHIPVQRGRQSGTAMPNANQESHDQFENGQSVPSNAMNPKPLGRQIISNTAGQYSNTGEEFEDVEDSDTDIIEAFRLAPKRDNTFPHPTQTSYENPEVFQQREERMEINMDHQSADIQQEHLSHQSELPEPGQQISPRAIGGVGSLFSGVEDGSEPLYSDGFQDRVWKFKSEIYGNQVDQNKIAVTANYLMLNPSYCQNMKRVDVLYLIRGRPQSDEERMKIRQTFTQSIFFEPFTIVHVFLVGKTTSPNFQKNLLSEQEEYGDIVQGDFMDKVENSTSKGLMGMRWFLEHCPQASFVMNIDEGVFVDSGKLLRGLIPAARQVIGKRAILCYFNPEGPIPRSGPNAISRDLFPNESVLRPYCKGFAVLLTPLAVASIVAASEHVPVVPFSDLYLYGVLPFVAGNVEVYDMGDKHAFHMFGQEVVNCYTELGDRCPFVATKAFSARFSALWACVAARRQTPQGHWQGPPSLWDLSSYKRKL